MNKIFKNKIFLLLMFSVLFVLAFNCNSFAVSSTCSFTDDEIGHSVTIKNLPEEVSDYEYMVLGKNITKWDDGSGCYGVFIFLSNFPIYTDESGEYLVNSNVGEGGKYLRLFCYPYYNSKVALDLSKIPKEFDFSTDPNSNCSAGVVRDGHIKYSGSGLSPSRDLLYSNCDILVEGTDKVVFQGAPRAQVEPLMEITQVEEIQPVVAKIVDLVLPACLIIFGTLLVLYLIKSKNLLQV